jgi:hypothetical protein
MKTKHLLIADAVMFAVAIGILTSFFISERDRNAVVSKRHWYNPDSPETLEKSLANIKTMRSKIERWSRTNQDVIREMLRTKAQDPKSVEVVISKIPAPPRDYVSNFKGLDFGPMYVTAMRPEVLDSLGIEKFDIEKFTDKKDSINSVNHVKKC